MPEKTSPAKPARARPARKPAEKATGKPAEKSAPEGERIAKVLSRAGIASRREAERLIEAGEVKVNGKLVTSPALNIGPRDKVTVSGQPVGAPEPARLWLYYKPEGLVTSASDEKGRDTVFDHLPEDMPRVMSVGRLDLNSEGLLLLTNDGALKRQLELPSTGWLRKYRVRVKGNPTDPELDPLRKGITVEGERFQPMEVMLDRHQGANAWLTVGLREGKNREIRRAMTEIGLTVNRLIRISYGPFRLNELKPGEVEEVRARVLRDQLGALMPDAPEGAEAPRTTGRRPAKPEPEGTRSKPVVRRSSAKSTDRERDDGRPATPRSRARPAEDAPGRVTSATGRAGLKSLSQSWKRATEGDDNAARPARPPRRQADDVRAKAPRRAAPADGATKAPRRHAETAERPASKTSRSKAGASERPKTAAPTRSRKPFDGTPPKSPSRTGGKPGATSRTPGRGGNGTGGPARQDRSGPKRGK